MTDSQPQTDNTRLKRESRNDPQIFLCDASAEAGRLLSALQHKGYAVVDVPLGMMVRRCRYEVPELVICDADAHEARSKLQEMRATSSDQIQIVLLGQSEGSLQRDPDLKSMAAAAFTRPLDIDATVERLSALCSAPRQHEHRQRLARTARAPRLVTAARKPYRSDGRAQEPASSRPPQSDSNESSWPIDSPPSRGPLGPEFNVYPGDSPSYPPLSSRSSSAPPSSEGLKLSAETSSLLQAGKKRLNTYSTQPARPIRLPMGTEQQDISLRPELLAALSEDLDDVGLAPLPHSDASEITSAGTKNTSAGTNAAPRSRDSSTAIPQSVASVVTSPTEAHNFANEVPTSKSQPSLEARVEHEEKTNPGGRSPSGPPSEMPLVGLSELDEPDDLSMNMGSQLPPLDDLSDLLNEGKTGRSLADQYTLTTPPPKPPRSVTGQTQATQNNEQPAVAPSLPASFAHQVRTPERHATAQMTPSQSPANAPQSTKAEAVVHKKTQASHELQDSQTSLLISLPLAIRERRTGAVAQQASGGVRRVILTDGDISTVISGIVNESLAHFLHLRGDVSDDVLPTLNAIPAFGRHAGAALIARGLLQQEDLWPVLRSHSEWILGQALRSQEATQFETAVPQRMLDEPAVFGGSAGTEIFLDAVRRVVSNDEALARLGGGSQVLGLGSARTLLGESALAPEEQQELLECVGIPLENISKKKPELLPMLLALSYIDVLTAGGSRPTEVPQNIELRSQEIDDEAFKTRLLTRFALVEEGDYFSILGIARSATSYEVERARNELLDFFSEDALNARTLHLRDKLELLRSTIEEAHLVLHDETRRQRYRFALEASPGTSR